MRSRRPALAALALAASFGLGAPACLLNTSAYESAHGSTGTAGTASTTGTGIGGSGAGDTGAGAGATTSGTAGGSSQDTTGSGAGGSGGTGAAGGSVGSGGSGGGPVAGDLCPGIETSIALYSELLIDNGDTTGATDDEGSLCGGGDGPDVVYAVTVLGKGYLTATLEADAGFDGIVYIRESCKGANSELGCGITQPVTVPVEKDTVVYVYVDGLASGPSGTFKLTLALNGCGNGTIEKEHEECDDGNIQFGDGCAQDCNVECDCPAGVSDCMGFEDQTTHHCYALIKGSDKDWAGGKGVCETWKGTLAVLATQEEINAVKPSLSSGSNEIWIGGSDTVVDGTFVWENGEPWTYTNGNAPWKDNIASQDEPNGGNGENCVEIYKNEGNLNDEQCSQSHDYLCERPPAGEAPGINP